MKKVIAIIVSLLFVLSVAGLSFAAEEKKAPAAPAAEKKAAPAGKKEAAPAKVEEKKAPEKVKQVTGDVAAVDAKANTLTVKGKKGDVAITADAKTTVKIGKEKKTLADVKVGDKVTVKYTEVGGKNVAKSVAVAGAAEKKALAAPAAEKKAAPPVPAKK